MPTELSPNQIRRFNTWPAAKDFLASLEAQYIFRGMPNAGWSLMTTLDRASRFHHSEAEKLLVESFRQTVPINLIIDPPPVDDRMSWLAIMRHFGLPSRLLDCTESPSIAAYFAIGDSTSAEGELAIWAFNKEALRRSAQERLGILAVCDIPLSPGELGGDLLFPAAFELQRSWVALVDAKYRTPRQVVQKGLFLCPGDPGYWFWIQLLQDPYQTQDFMYQVVLPGRLREDILNDLRGTNINHANLLPENKELEKFCADLSDHLARSQHGKGHFKWKLEVERVLKDHSILRASLSESE